MNTKMLFRSLIILHIIGEHIKLVNGDILIIPLPMFSALHRSAGLAQHLKENGYNVTVVLPDGQPKKALLEEFDFNYIVSEGMTKALDTIEEVLSSVVPYAFTGSKLGMIHVLSVLKLRRLCYYIGNDDKLYEPRREKTGLRGFRPGPTQTGLYKLRKELEA